MARPNNPICRDCRHSVMQGLPWMPFLRAQYCGHPDVLNCVTGVPVYACAEVRTKDSPWCTRAGTQWEPVNIIEPSARRGQGTEVLSPRPARRMLWEDLEAPIPLVAGPRNAVRVDAQGRVVPNYSQILPDANAIAGRFAAKVAAARVRKRKPAMAIGGADHA
jgi:hypothetical protein